MLEDPRTTTVAFAIHPVDLVVGRNLRQLRQDRRLSQAALADALGISFQQVQKYELGRNRVSASMLFECARVLAVDIGRFFDGAPSEPETAELEQTPEPVLSGEAQEALRLVNRIPDREMRRLLVSVARALSHAPDPP